MFLRNSAVERGRQHNLRHCAATGQVVPLPRRKMSQCHKIETKTKKLCHKIENKKKTLMSRNRNQTEDTMSQNKK